MALEFLQPITATLDAMRRIDTPEGPALELKFEAVCAPEVLDHLHAGLSSALMDEAEPGANHELPGMQHNTYKQRFPGLVMPLRWHPEAVPYTLVVHVGITDRDPIRLGSVHLKRLAFACMQLGTVVLFFTLTGRCALPAMSVGVLAMMVRQKVRLTLVPGPVPVPPDLCPVDTEQ